MFSRSLGRTAVGLAALALPMAGLATLVNASFETPEQVMGGYSVSGIPGWSGGTGVWYIPTAGFFQTTAPDGHQIGYSNSNFMAQQSTNVIGAGVNSVTVQAGRRHDGFSGSFKLNIYAGGSVSNGVVTGGTLLASTPFDYNSIPPDSFTLVTATYTAQAGDPVIGQFVTVQFQLTAGAQMDMDDVRIYSPDSQRVAPTSLTVNYGRITSGDATKLALDDGDALVICKFIVPNQTSPIVQFAVNGNTTFTSLTALRFSTKAAMVQAGSFSHILKLYNFATSAYEETTTGSIGLAYQFYDLPATGDPNRYLGSGGALKSLVQIKQNGPSTSATPCASFDLAVWDLLGS